jgi:hypothetical protein
VVLREVGFSLSGKFTCEVTTDAPLFSTAAVSKDMLVVGKCRFVFVNKCKCGIMSHDWLGLG